MAKSMLGLAVVALLGATAMRCSLGYAAQAPANTANSDWPQYCGPTRDSVAVNSPKLLDAWPKEGPPLAWKSEWIPGYWNGGCSGPVVADGKVYVYSTWKQPLSGNLYDLYTPEALANAGWLPDLPADLGKKIEDARTAKGRPACQDWQWWVIKDEKEKVKQLDEYLAKKPELDKYIKDFIAALDPKEAAKYGAYIKKRLCTTPDSSYGSNNGYTPDQLLKLSKLQGKKFSTLRECAGQLAGIGYALGNHFGIAPFLKAAWLRSFTMSDTLVCLDAATGKTLWKKDFPVDAETQLKLKDGGWDVNFTLGLCGTPAIWEGKCYFDGATGLYCLSAKDGTLIWQVNAERENASVLVANGIVYSCGTAYEAATGRLLWKAAIGKGKGWGTSTSPSLWRSGGKSYIIAHDGQNQVCCLDMETGKDVWKVPYKLSWVCFYTHFATLIDSDILALEGKTYKMTPTELQPLPAVLDFKGKIDNAAHLGAGQVIYQDHLYQFFSRHESPKFPLNGPCCWDLKTGELNWNFNNGLDVAWYTPTILADGKIIMPLGKGYEDYVWGCYGVAMIKATPEKYVPLGSFEPGLIPWTPMALAGGRLFVRTEVGISCYDLRQK